MGLFASVHPKSGFFDIFSAGRRTRQCPAKSRGEWRGCSGGREVQLDGGGGRGWGGGGPGPGSREGEGEGEREREGRERERERERD